MNNAFSQDDYTQVQEEFINKNKDYYDLLQKIWTLNLSGEYRQSNNILISLAHKISDEIEILNKDININMT